jgi:hypothetical protein
MEQHGWKADGRLVYSPSLGGSSSRGSWYGVVARAGGAAPSRAHCPLASNERWCGDAFEVACWDGVVLRVASVLNCRDHQCLAIVAVPRVPDTDAYAVPSDRTTVPARRVANQCCNSSNST